MIKKLLTSILMFTNVIAYAQDRYVVQLTDKNNSPFSISNPSAFLTTRSIQRRANQGIAINVNDLPVNQTYVSGIANTGAAILSRSKWLNTVTIETSSQSVLNAINALPYVSSVNNVGRVSNHANDHGNKFDRETFSKDKFISQPQNRTTSPQSFDYGQALNQISMLGGDMMHNNGYTGDGIVIAIIDAGFLNADQMFAFDSLRAHNQILGTWDFITNDANVYEDDAHGAMVFSTMGSNWPGTIVGTAPGAKYWLLRSEYAPSENIIEEYNWAAAAEYADSVGADIINSSLGYTTFDNAADNHTYADMDGNTAPSTRAADFAASKGMVVCNSAGNEGSSQWHYIGAPADADSILTVGAVDDMGFYAGFSSAGPTSDGRVKPNVVAQGQGTFVADPFNGGTFAGNGTSFSSPVMAGMVATLWQCHPQATNMQIIAAIQQSASQANNPDSTLGYGIPNFPQACIILGIMTNNGLNGENLEMNGPNPFTNSLDFTFYSNKNQPVEIRLYDLLGNLVFASDDNYNPIAYKKNFSIPGAALRNGMYVLRITSGENTYSKKVIKF